MYQIILMKLCLVCMQFKLVFFKLYANSLKHFSGLTLVLYYSQLYVELLFSFYHYSAVSLSEILHKDKKLRNKLEKVFWPGKQKGKLKVK